MAGILGIQPIRQPAEKSTQAVRLLVLERLTSAGWSAVLELPVSAERRPALPALPAQPTAERLSALPAQPMEAA